MKIIKALPRWDIDPFDGLIKNGKNTAVTEVWIYNFYGNLMDEELPISNEVYQEIYDISTPAWKDIWTNWKQQGILN